ncbi:hypothetical protein PPMP20_02110 [Paraburkholderia phymatum]|uniref:hypothetical protein n=1 Tax=Paraburkholderia phymatum TaxID=148447 RepID=UPI0005A1AA14|nr:hypothetical protein [Paraburkholderia phymatum]
MAANLQLFFGPCPEGSKHRARQQRQCGVDILALPATHLILILSGIERADTYAHFLRNWEGGAR